MAAGHLFVLGGARSGKTAFAEQTALATGMAPIYLATGGAGDAEMAARIEAHRAARGPAWRTVEEPLNLAAAISRESRAETVILVDCLTLWLSNLMADDADPLAAGAGLVEALAAAPGPVILVSNEVGQGIVPANPLARRFRDAAGRLHQTVAAAVPRAVFIVAGLPINLKG